MKPIARSTKRLILCFIQFVALASLASGAWALDLDQTVDFNIPKQKLDSALVQFSEQAKIQITSSSDQVKDFSTDGIVGRHKVSMALKALLQRSGLSYKPIGQSAISIGKFSAGSEQSTTQNASSGSSDDANSSKEAGKKTSQDFQLAQVDQGAAGPQVGNVQNSEKKKKEEEGLTEIVVTGTHLKGVTDSPSPVQIYTRDDIERSGSGSIAQFIQTLPQNYNNGGSTEATTLSAIGGLLPTTNAVAATGVNLRGLGNDATITLIDGHRVAAGNLSGDIVDISMIPLSAVERIEVLTDGASAIYGSDAVGGVVNIIMRKSFDGAETRARFGSVTDGNSRESQIAQAVGKNWGSGSALVSYEFYDRTPLSAADRSFSDTAVLPFTLLPEQVRQSVWTSVNQDIGSNISVYANGLYSHRSEEDDNTGAIGTGLANHDDARINSYDGVAGVRIGLSAKTDVELSVGYSASDTNIKSIYPPDGRIEVNQHFTTSILSVDGILRGSPWTLPAGPVRYAVGGQYRDESYDLTDYVADDTFHPTRSIWAAFAEVRIPLIGGEHKVELSIADRAERYSDFGSTNDPQLGIIWQALSGFKVRGTYGKSFVAPLLYNLNPVPSPVLAFNTALIPGSAPTGGGNVNVVIPYGGNPNLKAQTADTWTLGADWKPLDIPGLTATLTYYGANYSDRIASALSAGYQPVFDLPHAATLGPQIVQINPPASLVQQLLANPSLVTLPGFNPADVYAVIDARSLNLSFVKTQGVDLDVAYRRDLGVVSTEFGVASTYLLKYDARFTSASPTISIVDTLNNPTRLKSRGRIVMTHGSFSTALFVNYTSAYQNTSTIPSTPVSSWTTEDLTGTYECHSCVGFLNKMKVTLGIVNITNRNPPFVNQGDSAFPINYDGANANPLGRFVSLELTKGW